ncbi:MAG: hypothetical protein AB8B60_09490 [Sulfitobacter sp.]
MLAIGFLSLLGLSFAVMGGGDDDTPDTDENARQDDDVEITRGDLEVEFIPGEDLEPEAEEAINDFVESIEDNPQQDIEDVVDDLHDLLDDLGLTDDDAEEGADAEDGGDTADSDEEQGGRPPIGPEYRDPLLIAEELDAQRILDEIAAEEARQPVNLVTVSGASGAEVADALVMTEGPEEGEDADRSFIVTGPEGSDHDIDVRYDAEHTFKIEFNEDTETVTAALNSNIEGPEGSPQKATSTTQDENGDFVVDTTWTNGFTSSTDITINVTPDQIGAHVAQIDLLNASDALDFEFSDDVSGNFHLVFYESEDGDQGETSASKRAFIVQTASTQDEVSASEVQAIAENGEMRSGTFNVLAEIYLGNDALFANAVPEEGEDPATWVNDFINDDPLISANIDWASVSERDDGVVGNTAPAGEEGGDAAGGDGDTVDDDIADLFEGAGLNPGFFGF